MNDVARIQGQRGLILASLPSDLPGQVSKTLCGSLDFNPAVKVVSAGGARPVSGATVTLLRADSADQPFELLAEGSDFLSPGNRANPALTTGNGHNGWNMRAGTYRYEATAAGCVDAADASQTTVSSAAFTVDLNHPAPTSTTLTFSCEDDPTPKEPETKPEPKVEPELQVTRGPKVTLNLKNRCVAPRTAGRPGSPVTVPLRAALRLSKRAKVKLLIERRAIAPDRYRCPAKANPPRKRSAFKRAGQLTRTLAAGNYRLVVPVRDRRATKSAAAKQLRLPVQRLRRGTYRITITATDKQGKSSTARGQFMVLAARR